MSNRKKFIGSTVDLGATSSVISHAFRDVFICISESWSGRHQVELPSPDLVRLFGEHIHSLELDLFALNPKPVFAGDQCYFRFAKNIRLVSDEVALAPDYPKNDDGINLFKAITQCRAQNIGFGASVITNYFLHYPHITLIYDRTYQILASMVDMLPNFDDGDKKLATRLIDVLGIMQLQAKDDATKKVIAQYIYKLHDLG